MQLVYIIVGALKLAIIKCLKRRNRYGIIEVSELENWIA